MNDRNTPHHGNPGTQPVFPRHDKPLPPGRVAHRVALVLAVLLSPGFAKAQDLHLDPFTHGNATTVGLAGTCRATPGNLDNILHGSAPLALDSRYDIDVSGFLEPGGWKGFDVAAVDSRTSTFALGVRYSWARHDDLPLLGSELPGWELAGSSETNPAVAQHLAVGMAITPDQDRRWSVGLHGGYFWRNAARAGDGMGARIGASVAGRPHDTLTMSLGGTVPFLVEAARGTEDQPTVDAGLRWQPHEDVGIVADAGLPLDTIDGLDFGVGSEWSIAGIVPVRVGYSRDAGDVRNALGAGVGVVSEYLNLHYGVWFDLGPDEDGLALPRHVATIAMWM